MCSTGTWPLKKTKFDRQLQEKWVREGLCHHVVVNGQAETVALAAVHALGRRWKGITTATLSPDLFEFQ